MRLHAHVDALVYAVAAIANSHLFHTHAVALQGFVITCLPVCNVAGGLKSIFSRGQMKQSRLCLTLKIYS